MQTGHHVLINQKPKCQKQTKDVVANMSQGRKARDMWYLFLNQNTNEKNVQTSYSKSVREPKNNF